MKKIISVLIIGVSLLSSCNKSFLDQASPTSISPLTFYKTAPDFQAALNSTYGALQGSYMYWFVYGDVTSDDAFTAPGAGSSLQGEFDLPPVNATNFNLNTAFWNPSYLAIARANIVLNRIDGTSIADNQKKQFTGEAKFIRALTYFNLVRVFGDVPLVLKEIPSADDAFSYSRETLANVYAQIIKDLQDAEQALPVSYSASDAGKATSGAAKTILATVYLTQHKFAEAAAKLKEVIDTGTYSLLSNYNDIFNPANGWNKEIVFAINYQKGGIGEGSPFPNFFIPNQSGNDIVPAGAAAGYAQITEDLDQAFEANDLRKSTSVGVYQSVFKYTRKYLDVPSANYDSNNDWIVTRYADVLLMYAEALNETGSLAAAITNLNIVRTRAGLPNKTATDIPTQDAFRLAVEHERRVELSLEGHRWFDLIRTNRVKTVMNAYYIKENVKRNGVIEVLEDFMLLCPIPTSQVNINPDKIKQNPGY